MTFQQADEIASHWRKSTREMKVMKSNHWTALSALNVGYDYEYHEDLYWGTKRHGKYRDDVHHKTKNMLDTRVSEDLT